MKKLTPDDSAWNSFIFFLLGGLLIGTVALLINLSADQAAWLCNYDGIIGAVATIFAGALAFFGVLFQISVQTKRQEAHENAIRIVMLSNTVPLQKSIHDTYRYLLDIKFHHENGKLEDCKHFIKQSIAGISLPDMFDDVMRLAEIWPEAATSIESLKEECKKCREYLENNLPTESEFPNWNRDTKPGLLDSLKITYERYKSTFGLSNYPSLEKSYNRDN